MAQVNLYPAGIRTNLVNMFRVVRRLFEDGYKPRINKWLVTAEDLIAPLQDDIEAKYEAPQKPVDKMSREPRLGDSSTGLCRRKK